VENVQLPDGIRSTWRLLLKEISAFGVVGALCFLVDIGVFQMLYAHAGVGAVLAKLTSTTLSTTLAYFGHRYWSFSHRARTGLRREYTLFFVVNGATLVLGLAIVWFVRYPLDQTHPLVLQAANIASIGLGTIIRYLAYRQWVFPAPEPALEVATAGAGRAQAQDQAA
jgi:putative flippase GtrA